MKINELAVKIAQVLTNGDAFNHYEVVNVTDSYIELLAFNDRLTNAVYFIEYFTATNSFTSVIALSFSCVSTNYMRYLSDCETKIREYVEEKSREDMENTKVLRK